MNTITTGDCIEHLTALPPGSVNLIVADPPYNIGIDYGDGSRGGDREGYVERGKLAEACERFGIAYGTAKNAAMVAAAFDERSLRRDLLDFGHHQAVANHPQAVELLEWAAETGATVKQLREQAQEIKATDARGRDSRGARSIRAGGMDDARREVRRASMDAATAR